MELSDIKGISDMQQQAKVYGIMVEQIADNIQDLKHLVAKNQDIDVYADLLKKLNDAQRKLYQASGQLAEFDDEE